MLRATGHEENFPLVLLHSGLRPRRDPVVADVAAQVRRGHGLGRGDRRAGRHEEDQQAAAADLRVGQAQDGRRREAAGEVHVADR